MKVIWIVFLLREKVTDNIKQYIITNFEKWEITKY
jgi:hypothetical protein